MTKIDELLREFSTITNLLKEANDRFKKLIAESENKFNLTDKEKEVYELFLNGIELKEIAIRLNMHIKTATTHRDRIRKKMGLIGVKDFYRHLKEKR